MHDVILEDSTEQTTKRFNLRSAVCHWQIFFVIGLSYFQVLGHGNCVGRCFGSISRPTQTLDGVDEAQGLVKPIGVDVARGSMTPSCG